MMTDDKPLDGITVVSLAQNVPGPVAAQKLQSLGASVIKIEPPGGDPLAEICPPWYKSLSAGQQIVCLDLKSTGGHYQMEEYLRDSDVFISSIRPSALHHLSLSHSDLQSRYPRLCQVALVGYPPPDDNRAGHDLIYRASLGLLSPPYLPRTLLVDLAGAQQVVSSVLTLLFARERGKGAGYYEVALSECVEIFADPARYGLTTFDGILGGGSPQYNLYETQKGWIAVAALERHFWETLTNELGFTGSNIGYEELREKFLTKTADEWEIWAIHHDLPVAVLR